MPIDELNILYSDDELDNLFEEFYGQMKISEEQKRVRKMVAGAIRDAILFLFVLVLSGGDRDYDYLLSVFMGEYWEAIKGYMPDDTYAKAYLETAPREILETTLNHLDLTDTGAGEFYISDERATISAMNEANTVVGYAEYADNVKQGKKYKVWETMKDTKVRESHRELEGVAIPIDDYFYVGNSMLQFPRDVVNCTDIRDIAGCRCVLSYR